MSYAQEKLIKALIHLDGSGTPQERLTYAGLELAISLGPEHFSAADARTRFSAIMERLEAREDVASHFWRVTIAT